MSFIKRQKMRRLMSPKLAITYGSARDNAQFHIYSMVAARFRGFEGWERTRIFTRPKIVYDLSGLPLFYDFTAYRGRKHVGFVRTAANKALGDPVIGTQVTPPGWNMNAARNELRKLVKRRYPRYAIGRMRLVCYSYPKLALSARIVSPRGKIETLLMDVGDFTEISREPGRPREFLGQVPYSLLNAIPEEQEKKGQQVWEKINRKVEDVFKEERELDPKRLSKLAPVDRLAVLKKEIFKLELFKIFNERVLDFCCHTGSCMDHECFCLHPQENNVHCARAAAQMMLCYWRYCYSQHEIAQAYGVNDNVGTPVAAVVPGLESLTNQCFDATLHWTVNWSTYNNEISKRRPLMSCVPGHARACAGTKQWNIWIINTPRPRYLYIFDPWPPNTGAIYWENFNTTTYLCTFTLERKSTNHT